MKLKTSKSKKNISNLCSRKDAVTVVNVMRRTHDKDALDSLRINLLVGVGGARAAKVVAGMWGNDGLEIRVNFHICLVEPIVQLPGQPAS